MSTNVSGVNYADYGYAYTTGGTVTQEEPVSIYGSKASDATRVDLHVRDGKDDGKTSTGDKVASFFGGIGKTIGDGIVDVITDPKKLLLTAAIVAASFTPIGPVVIAGVAAAGVVGGVKMFANGLDKSNASTDTESLQGYEEMGGGAFITASSAVALKASLPGAKTTVSNAYNAVKGKFGSNVGGSSGTQALAVIDDAANAGTSAAGGTNPPGGGGGSGTQVASVIDDAANAGSGATGSTSGSTTTQNLLGDGTTTANAGATTNAATKSTTGSTMGTYTEKVAGMTKADRVSYFKDLLNKSYQQDVNAGVTNKNNATNLKATYRQMAKEFHTDTGSSTSNNTFIQEVNAIKKYYNGLFSKAA